MARIKAPAELREKLGDQATEELLDLIAESQQEQRSMHVFQDSFALRIKESENQMREHFSVRIQESEDRMIVRIQESEHRMSRRMDSIESEMKEFRKETHTGFLDMQKQITGIQSQISTQTRWLIGAASFLVIVKQLMDWLLP